MSEEMLATIKLAIEIVNEQGGAVYCLDTDTGKQVKVSNNITKGCKTVVELNI